MALAASGRLHTIFGGHKAVARPDPIPNSAVKRSLADGSACIACARVGCRQIFQQKAETARSVSAFLLSRHAYSAGEFAMITVGSIFAFIDSGPMNVSA